MIKECSVRLNNEFVTVARYGDVDVQFPAIKRDTKTIFVNYENGKYSVVDKDYKSNNSANTNKKKGTNKTTTIEQSANNEVAEIVTNNEDA